MALIMPVTDGVIVEIKIGPESARGAEIMHILDIHAGRQVAGRREIGGIEGRQITTAGDFLIIAGVALAGAPDPDVADMALDVRVLEKAVEVDEP